MEASTAEDVDPSEAPVSSGAGGTAHSAETSGRKRIVKNATIYMVSQLVSWAVTFVSLALIPRRLGDVALGQIAVASAAVNTAASLLSFSIEQFIVPEVGRHPDEAARLVRAVLGLRLAVVPVMLLASFAALYVMQASRTIWILGGICAAFQIIAYFLTPMRAVLAGWEDARTVSLIDLFQSSAALAALPALPFGVVPFKAADTAVNLPVLLWSAVCVRKRLGSLRPTFDIDQWRRIVRSSLNFLVNEWVGPILVFSTVYLLKHFGDGEGSVGVYAQAQRLLGTFLFVPTAVGAALLPSLTRLAESDRDALRRLQQRITITVMMMGMPVAMLAFMLADPFCQLLYGPGRFQTLPITLKFCGLAVIPLYVTIILYRFLVAERKNGVWGLFMLSTVLLNSVLCTVLIPLMQHAPHIHAAPVGAVLSFAIAEFCSMVMAFILLKTNPLNRESIGRLGRAVFAAILMGSAMWACRDLFFVIRGALGTFVFAVTVWKLEVLGREDQEKIRKMVVHRLEPFLLRFSRTGR